MRIGDITGSGLDTAFATLTLGDILDLLLADPAFLTMTLADLGGPDLLGAVTFGDVVPGAYGAITIGDILSALATAVPGDPGYGLTLGDLLAGILPPSDFPWQNLDLATAAPALQAATFAQGENYNVDVTSSLPSGTQVIAHLGVPKGYLIDPSSIQLLDGAVGSPGPTSTQTVDPITGVTNVVITLYPRQGLSKIRFLAVSPIDLGQTASFTVTLDAPDWAAPSSAGQEPSTIVDGSEPLNDSPLTEPSATPVQAG